MTPAAIAIEFNRAALDAWNRAVVAYCHAEHVHYGNAIAKDAAIRREVAAAQEWTRAAAIVGLGATASPFTVARGGCR